MNNYRDEFLNGSGRRSIDGSAGFPIIVEYFTIPVFKGSTLTTHFEFPFNLATGDEVTIVYGSPEILEDATIVQINPTTVSVTWAVEVIEALDDTALNTLRVRVTRPNGEVHTYNEIAIKIF